jgi:hypothetical protein
MSNVAWTASDSMTPQELREQALRCLAILDEVDEGKLRNKDKGFIASLRKCIEGDPGFCPTYRQVNWAKDIVEKVL